VQSLLDGIADIGVLADGTPTAGLDTQVIGHDELVIVCSKAHSIKNKKSISFYWADTDSELLKLSIKDNYPADFRI
jgi:DNA-binding transcriptional LysR family regulator